MDRLFLDANVLFSAAYRDGSGLLRLWTLSDAELTTSGYALEEARRNLDTDEQRTRLVDLMKGIDLVAEPTAIEIPRDVEVRDKDVPILAAALACGASHLVTGDRRDFGHLFGRRIGSLLVVSPRDYLDRRVERENRR